MTLQILLLKRDSDQQPTDSDLHPPSDDVLGRFPVTGSFDAVVLALVPDGLNFETRNRLPMDGTIYRVKEALLVFEPMQEGIMRW